MKNSKIFITGSEGFIGSHLTEALVRSGLHVKAFVLYNSLNSWGWLENIEKDLMDKVEVVAGDIRDSSSLQAALEGCEIVFHLAALIGIPYSYQAPESYVDTNIKGTLNLLQIAKKMQIKRFIHTSTSEVYGTAKTVPITESHPLHAQSPYAATKIAADHLVLSFFQSFGLPATILRPFNTYGPRQSARAVIPAIIIQILEGKKKIQLGSLHPTRDLVFIEDTVNAFIQTLSATSIDGEVIHFGTGQEISIERLAKMIAEILNVKIEIHSCSDRVRPPSSEVERLVADASKAEKILKWVPKYKGLDGMKKGLTETVAWLMKKENLEMYKAKLYNV